MSVEKETEPAIIDSFGTFNLYKDSDGSYFAEQCAPLNIKGVSFFGNSYAIHIETTIVDHSDWDYFRSEMGEALEAVEHFQDVIDSL